MENGIFKLNWVSVGDAVLYAVVVALLTAAIAIVQAPNFDVLSMDWAHVVHNMLNIAVITAVLTLGKEILSTNSGRFLGITNSNTLG